jgi:hypothetical protein
LIPSGVAFECISSTTAFGNVVRNALNEVPVRDWLRFGAAVALNSVQMPAKQNSSRLSSSANQTTSFLAVRGHETQVLRLQPTAPMRRRCGAQYWWPA